jgi:hypothetical protein
MMIDGLSARARSAIERCLQGRELTAESLGALSQHEIRSAPNVGPLTLKEILAWAGMRGIALPRWRSSPPCSHGRE